MTVFYFLFETQLIKLFSVYKEYAANSGNHSRTHLIKQFHSIFICLLTIMNKLVQNSTATNQEHVFLSLAIVSDINI